MSSKVSPFDRPFTDSANNDLMPMREAIQTGALKKLRPIGQPQGNPNPLAGRNLQPIQPPAPPASASSQAPASENESEDGSLSLVLGGLALAGTAGMYAYNYWFPEPAAQSPVVAAPEVRAPVANPFAPPHIAPFNPLNADPKDLEAIRLAAQKLEQARLDAELAQRIADEDAQAAALAAQQRQNQIRRDGTTAQTLQNAIDGRPLN